MSASVNKVFILGHLGKDPELRYTGNQTAVATLSIATTEYFEKDGNKQEKTEWHSVVAWGKQAENASKYLAKGRPVFVEGKLQTRKWQDKEGKDRWSTEIVAQNIQYLGSGQGAPAPGPQPQAQNNQGQQPGYPDSPGLDNVPF